mgnify:CR=1 FL=1
MSRKIAIERDQGFYGSVLSLAIPLALQSALMYSVTTLNSIMLGALGEIPMSASAIADQPFNIVSGIFRGLTLGGAILIAQYWGKGDTKAIRRVIAIGIRCSVLISLLTAILVIAFPAPIMGVFSTDKAVIDAGIDYLRIVALTYPMFAVSNCYMLSVRATENARTPLLINLLSYGVNILLNYGFIFGKFGLPEMGITGVAIGTLLARGIEFVCVLVHMLCINKKVRMKLSDFVKRDKLLFKDFMTYAAPSLLSEMIFTIGMSAYSVIFGRLGTTTIAANTVAEMLHRIGSGFFAGLSGASSVIIGKTIGSGDIQRAKLQKKTFNVLAMGAGLFTTALLLVIKNFILSLYNIAPETYAMADKMIVINAIFMIAYAYESLYVTGLQVGSGDATNILIYTTIIMWGITMPIAFAGAFWFKLSPLVVFVILKCDYAVKGVYGYFRTRGDKWIKQVTRDEKDLQAQE